MINTLKKNQNMQESYAKIILFFTDIFIIFISLVLAYFVRNIFIGVFEGTDSYPLDNYIHFYLLYIVIIAMFLYQGVYTQRYDFWHESQIIIKNLMYALVIVLAYLAITRTVQNYSRAVILLAFLFMAFLIPLSKNIGKKLLFKCGLWRKKVTIYGDDQPLKDELFVNHYLGYVDAKNEQTKTIFINDKNANIDTIKKMINNEREKRKELILISRIDEFDLTQAYIHKLTNVRTNLIVFENELMSNYKMWMKRLSDIVMFIIVFPLIAPILLLIAYKIRKEEPEGSIFFKQERLGKNNTLFTCYKFRTMYSKSDALLSTYLADNPDEVTFYEKYHKYQDDPRITKIGQLLRRTSLDELPQIFNVFKNEMSFVGPRPYMLNEKDILGDNVNKILSVRPGITGLWQVSGRNDVDFSSRISLDIWYIRNWNLWMDFVILFKTVKTVFYREGAK